MPTRIPVSNRRLRRQGGNEIIEFAVMAIFLVPSFLFVFINGMNLVRMNSAVEICRDIGSLYIRGTDFSTYGAQALAARLAQGFALNVGSTFAGNQHSNSGNGGNAYVILSEIEYVGPTTGHTCQGAAPSCVNHDSYVYVQHIDFGNNALQINGATIGTRLGGTITSATINSSGLVQNYLTDPNAVATNMSSLVNTQLADGQVIYVAETFFASPDLGFSAFPAGGIYQRTFF